MTPEQLEELPGVGPKTVEKISVAVSNYFSGLEGAPAPAAGEEGSAEAAPAAEGATEPGAEASAEGTQAEAGEAAVEATATADKPAVAEASTEVRDVPENETSGGQEPGKQET